MTREQQLALLEILTETLDENNIDVDVVRAISELRKKINLFKNPIFVENGVRVMKHYNEFIYSGLNNCDYILTSFYESGFGESIIVTNNNQKNESIN
jgi:hypothetical protein